MRSARPVAGASRTVPRRRDPCYLRGMRGIPWLASVSFLVSALVGACGGPPPGPCVGPNCECAGGDYCEFQCPALGCVGECHDVDNCAAGCGDDCSLDCHSSSNCELECGANCDARCESVSNCDVGCGADCAVDCSNLSNCTVEMISGEVSCTSVSNCDVQCVLPDGGREAAQDCGGGRFACPVGSC